MCKALEDWAKESRNEGIEENKIDNYCWFVVTWKVIFGGNFKSNQVFY